MTGNIPRDGDIRADPAIRSRQGEHAYEEKIDSSTDRNNQIRALVFGGKNEFEPIGSLLEQDNGINITYVTNPEEFVRLVDEVDCVIEALDLYVDDPLPIERGQAVESGVPWIVLCDDREAAIWARSAGADCCIRRGSDREALAEHVATAVRAELRPHAKSENGAESGMVNGPDRSETDRAGFDRTFDEWGEIAEITLDELADIFFLFDTDYRLCRWNERLTEVTGYDDGELGGMSPMDFVVDEDTEAIASAIDQAVETGTGREKVDLVTKAGEQIPYEFTGSLLTDHEGETIGICGTGRNIADRKRRQRALSYQTERLRTLNHINEVTREMNQALVRASTREEIERTVCENLAGKEPYRFAWIGERGAANEWVAPREWAGIEKGYLDDRPGADEYDTEHVTAATAIRTGEIQAAQRIVEDPEFEPWREAALDRGYQSAIAVPLTYRETTYGVLCVYASRPDAFDADERAVLSELGETIAYAISAAERRRALMADTVTELEFRLRDRSVGFVDLSAEASCEMIVDGIVPNADETIVAFLTAIGTTTEAVLGVVAEDPEVEVTVVADHGEEHVFRFTGPEPSVAGVIADHGGIVRQASADDGDGRLLVELPQNADVRAVVEGIEGRYEGTELLAQRKRDRTETTDAAVRGAFDDALTDRQREVLRVAYLSDYFEWPRGNTGEEIADLLGVSKPTFHEHIRTSERKLISAFFDHQPPVAIGTLVT